MTSVVAVALGVYVEVGPTLVADGVRVRPLVALAVIVTAVAEVGIAVTLVPPEIRLEQSPAKLVTVLETQAVPPPGKAT
jgi:hypothetical protein